MLGLKRLKNIIEYYRAKIWLEKNMDKNKVILICPYGIGDCLFVAFFLDDLLKRYKNIVVICKPYTKNVFTSFDGISHIYDDASLVNRLGIYCRRQDSNINRYYIYGHFMEMKKDFDRKYDTILKNYYYDILHLTGNLKIKYPMLSHEYDNIVLKKYGINKQSVIIAPYVKSSDRLSYLFWSEIVETLKRKKYDIYTNVGPGESALPDTKAFMGTLQELAICARVAKLVVSTRSGICDWLACTGAHLLIFNCNDIKQFTGWPKSWDVNYFAKIPAKTIDVNSLGERGMLEEFKNIVESN